MNQNASIRRPSSLSRFWALALLVTGCASFSRSCASCNAESFGSDWVLVQMDMSGNPFRCWELRNVSITNEEHSDGIYWQDEHGNLVHISNFYNRVQVSNGLWDDAYRSLGLTRDTCRAIREHMYTLPQPTATVPTPVEPSPR